MLALICLVYDTYIQLAIIDAPINCLPLTSMWNMAVHDTPIDCLGVILLYI